MPGEEDLHLAYQEYYTHGDANKPALRRIAWRLYRISTDVLLSLMGITFDRSRARRMFLGNRLPGTLLDVGCGSGAFLAEMRRRGWKVMGVDFDPLAVEAARSLHCLDVELGSPQALIGRGIKFDVITASHVLEHVPNPVEFLKHCRELLKVGGQMVLSTPNAESFGLRKFGAAWRGLEPPRHLYIFTLSAIENCALKAGLTVSKCFTSSANAEVILGASRLIARSGRLRESGLQFSAKAGNWIMRPLLAILAKLMWLRDNHSGEEIYLVLRRNAAAN